MISALFAVGFLAGGDGTCKSHHEVTSRLVTRPAATAGTSRRKREDPPRFSGAPASCRAPGPEVEQHADDHLRTPERRQRQQGTLTHGFSMRGRRCLVLRSVEELLVLDPARGTDPDRASWRVWAVGPPPGTR